MCCIVNRYLKWICNRRRWQCQAEKTGRMCWRGTRCKPKGQRRCANIGHMEPDAYKSVTHNIHKSQHNINERFARMLPSQVEGSKDSAVFPHYVEAVVPRWTKAQRPKVRLARRRESRGGQRMADVLFPPHSGCRAFVLDETKRLQDCRSSRLYRILREAMTVRTPELQRNNKKLRTK